MTPEYCKDCKYRADCIKRYGNINGTGEDYTAILGTHLCRKDMDECCEMCRRNKKDV